MSNQNTNETVSATSNAFNYAKKMCVSNRVAKRFEECFMSGSHPFESVLEKWPSAVQRILFLSSDIGLDRTNMTRSQIVMAYGRQNKAWNGIVAFTQISPERAYKILSETDMIDLKVDDARNLVVSKFAQ